MSRRSSSADGCLFVGRLSKSCRVRDLEDVFEPYGRMSRCEIKYGMLFDSIHLIVVVMFIAVGGEIFVSASFGFDLN